MANIVEGAIAICLIVYISYLILYMFFEYGGQVAQGKGFVFSVFLTRAIDLVIGIEFAKMLCRHTADNVIDVLMFATARQAILDHTRIMENLLAVFAIAILFLVRRYVISDAEKKQGKGPQLLCKLGRPFKKAEAEHVQPSTEQETQPIG